MVNYFPTASLPRTSALDKTASMAQIMCHLQYISIYSAVATCFMMLCFGDVTDGDLTGNCFSLLVYIPSFGQYFTELMQTECLHVSAGSPAIFLPLFSFVLKFIEN